MKKILALLLAVVMLTVVLAACAEEGGAGTDAPATDDNGAAVSEGGVINVWSFTNEIPNAIQRFIDLNPDFPYTINVTEIGTDGGGYQDALTLALTAGGADAPDIFTAESAFVLMYSQGDMSSFALPYTELFGRDVGPMISAAQIAPYIVDVGTRPSDNEVVALAFQHTGSAFIYRYSLAQQIWGDGSPEYVGQRVGPGWNQFLQAAQEAYDEGIAILPGEGDAWMSIRNVDVPWVVDGYLTLDAGRAQFLDVGYQLFNNDYTLKVESWSDGWFGAMSGEGTDRPVLGLLGPAWLINYVLADNAGDTYGDWRITMPPEGFSWGGTWVFANAQGNEAVRGGVATLLEWITLDTTDDGFQYQFGSGTLIPGATTKDAIASAVVMDRVDGTLEILGGQDMLEIFIPAGEGASGSGFGPHDETINSRFEDWAMQYFLGEVSRQEAIDGFKQTILDELGIPSR
ncbi:MAG: extracellular solute-binding protein [Oscillospiraceae bacterium]|nr:extracellular solute-binding protein [Oscillospiraceae bacterium]